MANIGPIAGVFKSMRNVAPAPSANKEKVETQRTTEPARSPVRQSLTVPRRRDYTQRAFRTFLNVCSRDGARGVCVAPDGVVVLCDTFHGTLATIDPGFGDAGSTRATSSPTSTAATTATTATTANRQPSANATPSPAQVRRGVVPLPALAPCGARPYGIACYAADEGDLIVTSANAGRVLRVRRDGAVVWAVGGPEAMFRPCDADVLPDGRIVVTDTGSNRLQVLDGATGEIVESVSVDPAAAMLYPHGIVVAADSGRVYVVDAGNHRVVVLSLTGELLGVLGTLGTGAGQLHFPLGIAVDRDGTVLVADHDNSRVVVFRPDGSTAHFDTLARPLAVAIDTAGRAWVTAVGGVLYCYE